MAAVFDDPKYDILFETLGDSRDPLRNRIEMIANITDWIDANRDVDTVCILTQDQSNSSVAEDTRYDRLPYNVQYKPKNGMMNSMEELRMVPYVNDAFMRLFSKYFHRLERQRRHQHADRRGLHDPRGHSRDLDGPGAAQRPGQVVRSSSRRRR